MSDCSIAGCRHERWQAFLPFPMAVRADAALSDGAELDDIENDLHVAFALGCPLGDPCWEGAAARGLALVSACRVTSRSRVQRSRTATGGASGIRTATSSSRHGSSRRTSPWHTRSAMNPPPRPAGHSCARWRAGRSSPGSSPRKRSRQPCRSVRGAEQTPAVSARSVAQSRGHDPRRGSLLGVAGPDQFGHARRLCQPAPFGR